MTTLSRWFRSLVRARRLDDQLHKELSFHLEQKIRAYSDTGMDPKEAGRLARLDFGSMDQIKEECRDARPVRWMETFFRDLQYGLRGLYHNPIFTLVAVLSLAFGIGINTAIYSFIESIMLRSLPVPHPESLVILKWRATPTAMMMKSGFSISTGGTHGDAKVLVSSIFPFPMLQMFQRNTQILSSAFCYFVADGLNLVANGESLPAKGQYVSGNYFQGMRVLPSAGRLLLPADDDPEASPVVVISFPAAQRMFGGIGNAVGKTIRINDKPFVVIGVSPRHFFGAEPGYIPDLFMPLHANLLLGDPVELSKEYQDPNYYWIEIMGRLKTGVDSVRAQTVLGAQFRDFVKDSAATEREKKDLPGLLVEKGAAGLDSLRLQYSKPLYVLMAMSGLILLIACANIANLLLARATARRREIAIRLSMGAGRLRIVRQLLTESLLLALIAGALGTGFAFGAIRFLEQLLANGRDHFTLHAALNLNVLTATVAISLLTGLLFGLVPAVQATGPDVRQALKEDQPLRLPGGLRQGWYRAGLGRLLVLLQIAFSFLLLSAAGLFGRTLANLHSIKLGFQADRVLLFSVSPGSVGYKGDALYHFYSNLRERLSQAPGIRSVGLSRGTIPSGGGTITAVTLPGNQGKPSVTADSVGLFQTGPGFFRTMQIPIYSGREFDDRDSGKSHRVAVVNKRLARALGIENPVGHVVTLRSGRKTDEYEIVGLAGDALYMGLKDDRFSMLYLPYTQSSLPWPPTYMVYEVLTSGNPLKQADSVRRIVRQVDPRLAVFDLRTQSMHINRRISQEMLLARLCAIFATLSLLIACVGLYGTVSFNVERRTGEIGIRMALGAQRAGILWIILREIFLLVLAGLVIGVPVYLAGARYVQSLLYGIKPDDTTSIAVAGAALLLSGLAAGLLPARRASGMNPIKALRHV